MSLNDLGIQSAKGDIYPGIANPTPSSRHPIADNFVDDPTTKTVAAGAGAHFQGHKNAERALNKGAGVIEHHPGIIESTNIEPLHSNKK